MSPKKIIEISPPDYSQCLDALDILLVNATQKIKEMAPNPDTRGVTSTGHLAEDCIIYEWIDTEHTAFRIYVNENKKTGAPYMMYLNEKEWSIHRGWWERACKVAYDYINGVIG